MLETLIPMSIDQKLRLAIVLIGGLIIGISFVLFKEDSWKWLLKYGALIAIIGLVSKAVIYGTPIFNILMLIETSGAGRAYIVGCAFIFGGIIAGGILICKRGILRIRRSKKGDES